MEAIDIRAAIPDDAAGIADYHDRCFRQTYAAQRSVGDFDAPDLAGTREQLRSWFDADSEFETYVAAKYN